MNLGSATFKVQGDGFDDLRLRFAKMKEDINELAGAQAQVGKAADAMGREVQRGARQSTWALMELSRGIEDMQYGFNAVVNNIPGFVMSLGFSGGIAGAASIAAVGINQLVQHWDYLVDAFQAAWSGSTLDQLQQIRQRAEEAAKAFDELAKKPTEFAARGAGQLEKAMVEGDLGKWLERVTVEVGKTPGLAATEEQVVAARQAEIVANPAKAAEKIDQFMFEANRKKAAELLAQAKEPGAKGDAARKILGGMNLPPEMMGAVQAADPAAQRRQADFEKQQRIQKEVQKRIAEQEKKHEQDREKELANAHRLKQEREAREKKAEVDAKRDAKEREALETKERHLRWRVEDIMNAGRPERAHAEFMGFGEFARSTQLGILNNPADIQKKQLDQLERIRRLLEDNPAQKQLILNAVAAGPP